MHLTDMMMLLAVIISYDSEEDMAKAQNHFTHQNLVLL